MPVPALRAAPVFIAVLPSLVLVPVPVLALSLTAIPCLAFLAWIAAGVVSARLAWAAPAGLGFAQDTDPPIPS